uniref:DBH-like monooxygenase protein 1 homolog n=1 Tax=Styela clava TaxID=7725 RepID=UPI001939EBEA|nr:DBH-like monooxygenase protein 1 homolog [Styela clava]
MNYCTVICTVALVAVVQGQMNPSESYTHSATLRSGNILLCWKFDDTYITFEVIGKTTGWLGIGFSPNGAMTSSDIFVGWVKNGIPTVTDRHGASSNTYPPLDPEQNIEVLGGFESNGWTMFKFSRQIAACESGYDREIKVKMLIYIVSLFVLHVLCVQSMFFLQSSGTITELPIGPEYKTFDVLATEFPIPTEDTYYNCKLYKLPDFDGKQHIVKWEPIIQTGNELFVHHMVMYGCGDILENEEELEQNARCYTSNMAYFDSCSTIILEWAIGASEMIYPEEAGFSVGGPGDPVYIQLETHYDNPNLISGARDSSGIRFTYTPTLRENDIGIMLVGCEAYGHELIIPPGAESFTSIGHCTDACLEQGLTASDVDNVTAFSVILHSHLAGRKLRLRHIRNGVELPYLANDENYDFNYQESRYLNPGVIIKNTDYLQMECDYSTKDRTVMTEGGLGTLQEMCESFVLYYPRINLVFCTSTVPQNTSWSYLGIDSTMVQKIDNTSGFHLSDYKMTEPADINGKTVLEYMSELNWTQQRIEEFEDFYNYAEHQLWCQTGNASQTTISTYLSVNITTQYTPPVKECQVTSTTIGPVITTSHGYAIKSPQLFHILVLFFCLFYYY